MSTFRPHCRPPSPHASTGWTLRPKDAECRGSHWLAVRLRIAGALVEQPVISELIKAELIDQVRFTRAPSMDSAMR